jgi:hypothetical protein
MHHRGQVRAMLAGTRVEPPQLHEFFLDAVIFPRPVGTSLAGNTRSMPAMKPEQPDAAASRSMSKRGKP